MATWLFSFAGGGRFVDVFFVSVIVNFLTIELQQIFTGSSLEGEGRFYFICKTRQAIRLQAR